MRCCVTHIIAVIGVHFNAFKADYTSTNDLYTRAKLDGVDYVGFEWEKEFLDQEILPMSYTTFTHYLHRVLLIGRFAVRVRMYAFRVGALY